MPRPLFLTLLATALIAAGGVVVSSCSVPGSSEADKCKVPPLQPGQIPSPEDALPSREDCPEFYEGRDNPPAAPGPGVTPPPAGGGPGVTPPAGPPVCATPEQRYPPCVNDCRDTTAC